MPDTKFIVKSLKSLIKAIEEAEKDGRSWSVKEQLPVEEGYSKYGLSNMVPTGEVIISVRIQPKKPSTPKLSKKGKK